MKKVLSFVLVLAMILGSVSMVFATPYTAINFAAGEKLDTTNTVVPFADAKENFVATILRDLGVIDGDANGNANLADGLTRAEAAALIVKAMGLGDQGAVQTTTKFADVKKADWFSGYVAVAAANGFVDGSNGKFNPNGKLTMDEAITLILKALGYDAAHLEGTWPTNYRDKAIMLNILSVTLEADGDHAGDDKIADLAVEVKYGTQAATRGDLFNLLFNCLYTDQPTVVWKQTAQYDGEFKSNLTLNLVQRITKKYGSVYTAFTSFKYTFAKEDNFVAAAKDFPNKYDASAYNGQDVYVLSKDSKKLCVAPVKAVTTIQGKFAVKNNVATFTAIDGTVYTGLAVDSTNKATIFENGGTKSTDATSFAPDTTTVYTLNLVCDKKEPTKNATIKAITYEKVTYVVQANATDVALFANENLYRLQHVSPLGENVGANAVFKEVLAEGTNGILTDAGVKTGKYLVLNSKCGMVIEGAATKLSEIQDGDIVEIYVKAGYTYPSKMVVTRNVVTGPITQMNAKAKTYTVNGTAYKFGTIIKAAAKDSDDEITPATINLGTVSNAIKGASEYAFYLDSQGKVAYAKLTAKQTKATYKYAFVLNATTTDVNVVDSKTGIATTVSNMAITLLPFDTMVAEKYELVSSAALLKSKSAYVATETDKLFTWTFPTATDYKLVKYYAVDGALKGITSAAVLDDTATKGFNRTTNGGFKFAATKLTNNDTAVGYFASGAKVYTVSPSAAGETLASVSAYKLTDVASMSKASAEDVAYMLNDNGYIDSVIVYGYTPATAKYTYVTVAAIKDVTTYGDEYKVTIMQPGKDAEELIVSASAADVEEKLASSIGDDGLVELRLANGKVIGAQVLPYGSTSFNSSDVAELIYNGNKLTNGSKTVVLNPVVKFMSFDGSVTTPEFTNIDDISGINEQMQKAKFVYVYQGAAEYDVVVVFTNVTSVSPLTYGFGMSD